MPPQPNPDVVYDVVEITELEAWLKDHFSGSWNAAGDQWTYSGDCPRCGHRVGKTFDEDGIFALEETDTDDGGAVMECNCRSRHEGRESGQGCGAYWGLALNSPSES
jgi:hypothetical protein